MVQRLTFGPVLEQDGVLFRFWCPLRDHVDLMLGDRPPRPMHRSSDGWFSLKVEDAAPGDLYRFRLPEGLEVPDPASRHQPEDVHGPSEVIDPAHDWTDEEWTGRPIEEIVLYELHVGAFTPEGTFRAAIEKLDHLRDLGVTAVQLMPIGDFPGRYGWGYDGTLPYAPEACYGRPEDLKALIDAAHRRGICVFLDVVYNHFGPDGNYLPVYAPFLTEKHKTPWGAGINFDDDGSGPVRALMIENALYWLSEFHVDGLRLDAVHAIIDDSREHLLLELARRARAAVPGREIHLIVENEDNDATLLARDAEGRARRYSAQWNDDIHHVLHIAATGETFGYYGDYAGQRDAVGRGLAEGFVFQGEHMGYRGEARGSASGHLPSTAFVAFIQNHDQIGNRAMGDRMAASQPVEAMKAIAAVYLLSPQLPMLFMGEEWGATEPFPYFCDFNETLNQAVREGRKRELSRLPGFDADEALDPASPETFATAKLDWSRLSGEKEEAMVAFYRTLLSLRREHIQPILKGVTGEGSGYRCDGPVVSVHWTMANGRILHLLANLSGNAARHAPAATGDVLFTLGERTREHLSPWFVEITLE